MASCSDSSGNTTCTLTVNIGTTSQADNSTPVTWALTARDSFGATHSASASSGTVTINGGGHGYTYTWSSAGTQTRTLESGSATINHDSDGGKTLSFSFTFSGIPGTSVGSMSASGTVTLPNVKPGTPSTPVISAITQTSFAIAFAPSSNGSTPANYTIEWDTDPNFGSPSSMTSTTASRTVTPLTPGTTVYVRERSNNASGSSAYSSAAHAVTLPPTPAAPTLTTPQPGELTVSWTGVTSATSYYVDYSTDASFATYTRVSVSGATSTTLSLAPGTYYVRVTAHNGSGNSPASPSTSEAVFAGGKRYDGTTWISTTIAKRWTGNSWTDLTIAKRWDGANWVNVS